MSMCYSQLNVNKIEVKECTGGLKENGDMYDYHNADYLLTIYLPKKEIYQYQYNVIVHCLMLIICISMSSNHFNIPIKYFFALY